MKNSKDNNSEGKDFIAEILGDFYKTEKTHSYSIVEKGNKYTIEFDFKQYERTKIKLDHISGNQIHEGIMEGMYLVIAKEIEKGNVEKIGLADFRELRATAIFREITIKFKKEIKLDSENLPSLDFEVINLNDIKGKYSKAIIAFSGFCEGRASAVVSMNNLVDDIIDN